MINKDKTLLDKYLCFALPYGVKCHCPIKDKTMTLTGKRLNYYCFHDNNWGIDYSHEYETVLDPLNDFYNGHIVKPYLRPMESMTEEERKEYENLCILIPTQFDSDLQKYDYYTTDSIESLDWLLKNHFDFMELIPKKLAKAVTEEDNPYKVKKIEEDKLREMENDYLRTIPKY